MAEPTGVLLMAYGTPAGIADVEAYYTHIRRGRPPERAQLQELIGRYRAIGGSSPLYEISRAQASGLKERLETERGERWCVELGMKHAPPFIEDGVRRLIGAGVKRAVALVLAPHYSALSVGEYGARAREAAGGRLELDLVHHWHLELSYLSLLAERVRASLESFPAVVRDEVDVVFTAHSLPVRILDSGDPYPAQLAQTAEAVAHSVGLERWSIAWQSAGRTSDEWLGPDITEVVRDLQRAGSRGVIVCPAGFVSDHLEILYDLDIECRAIAEKAGLAFRRTESPNSDPAFIGTLAEVVLEQLRAAVE